MRTSDTTTQELHAALIRKIAVFVGEIRELTEEEAGLFAKGITEPASRQPEPNFQLRARELLNGHGGLLPSSPDAGGEASRLADIRLERRARELCLDVLRQQETQTGALALAAHLAAGGEDQWNAALRALADGILTVLKAEKRLVELREQALQACPGVAFSLPAAPRRPVLTAEAQAVLERAREAGIVRTAIE